MWAALVHHGLDGVEERRNALDLVDENDHRLFLSPQLAAQAPRVLAVRQERRLIRQIDDQSGIEGARQRGFTDLPRAQQEQAFLRSSQTPPD